MTTEAKRDAARRRYKTLRAAVGKNQKQVEAAAIKLAGRYWKIENGWTDPTPEERRALARVFKVSEAELPAPLYGQVEAKAS